MSKITDFYILGSDDIEGRTLASMLSMTDEEMDARTKAAHTFIQWMFPLHEGSSRSSTAPILTAEDIKDLQASPVAKFHMGLSLDRFNKFFLFREGDDTSKQYWCRNNDHNLLRITRIIRSLRLFGMDKEAQTFYDAAEAAWKRNNLAGFVLTYWYNALHDPVMQSMNRRLT